MPTWDFDADFEAGDTSEFTGVVASPTASTASKKNGSYGCEITVSGTTAEYGVFYGGELSADTDVTCETQADTNGVTLSGNLLIILATQGSGTGIFDIEIRNNAGTYEVRLACRKDDATTVNSSWVSITDDYHKYRAVWRASSGSGQNNGYCLLYIDDVYTSSITGIDNDTLNCDRVRFGYGYGSNASNSGTIYIDDCRAADQISDSYVSGSVSSAGSPIKNLARAIAGAVSSIASALYFRYPKVLAGAVSAISSTVNWVRTLANPLTSVVAAASQLIIRLNDIIQLTFTGSASSGSSLGISEKFWITPRSHRLHTRETKYAMTARKRDYRLTTRGRGDY